jgi:ketosteroid isomerase-like protein
MDAVRLVMSFIDCINRGDVDGLGRLMSEDHTLQVFDEPALIGREANLAAWRGYVESYPGYRIHPHATAALAGLVAVLGHTTRSHLGLPDDQESQLTLIWLAEVADQALRSWTLVADTPANRQRFLLNQAC